MTSALVVLAIVAAFIHGHVGGRRQGRVDLLDHLARHVGDGA